MRKFFVLTAILLAAVTIESHAIGIGIQGGANVLDGFNAGLSILISPQEQIHGAVTWYLQNHGLLLGGSLDYWFWPKELTTLGPGSLIFFVGGGAYAQVGFWDDSFILDTGLRLPIGLDWKMDFLDVFVQAVPLAGLSFLPSLGFGGFHIDANLGVRFWIGG
jgi:hypothetical protein